MADDRWALDVLRGASYHSSAKRQDNFGATPLQAMQDPPHPKARWRHLVGGIAANGRNSLSPGNWSFPRVWGGGVSHSVWKARDL